jgi:tetratricopeptide (TPR) repeat protein
MSFEKAKVVRAAEKYLTQGKILPAITEYRKITTNDPGDFTALNMLGDLYVRVEKKQEAVECFARIADHYREQGFNLKAIAMLKKIDRLETGNPDISYQLATLYEAQGLAVDARSQYLAVADFYTKQSNVRKTLEILHRVADLDPHNVETRLKLAEGYQREQMEEEAAQAFTEAGAQLVAKGSYERAIEAFNRALEFSKSNYAAWSGVVTAYTALNAPDEAARALSEAGALESNDIELVSLLAQAHIADENVTEAEQVAYVLLKVDAAAYAPLLDVAQLYLKANQLDDCVRVLESILDPALNARAEAALVFVLDETLARNPEHLGALHLLVRIYKWQHEDENLRSTLERIAEVAQILALPDEERHALEQLQGLALNDDRYVQRLKELNGDFGADEALALMPESEAALYDSLAGLTAGVALTEEEFASPREEEIPLEISFTNDDFAAADLASADSSFAELSEEAAPEDNSGLDEHHKKALQQELESVDFYIGQGYYDIAQDTLDMLERQFGEQPSINARKSQLPGAQNQAAESAAPVMETAIAGQPEEADWPAASGEVFAQIGEESAAPAETSFSFAEEEPVHLPDFTADEAEDVFLFTGEAEQPAVVYQEEAAPVTVQAEDAPAAVASDKPALDPGLVAIFDEFREAVEEESAMPSDDDFETHYNLGLAYKEMDLTDEAVEEFQIAVKLSAPHDGTQRHLHCCSLLGHCFMQKDLPRVAVKWFQKGLETNDLPEEAILALRYEMGLSYEQMGDIDKANETFMEVYGVNVSYRNVGDKLRELQTLQPA